MLILLILSGVLLYSLYFLYNHFTYWQNLGIGCDKPNWIFGSFREAVLLRTFFDIFQDYYNKYKHVGPFAGFYWFYNPAVFVTDLALIKQILIKDFNKFPDRGWFVNERNDPLSGHLFNLEGEKWRYMRMQVAQQLSEAFHEAVEENSKVEVCDIMARYTTDVVGTCAFGLDCNSLKDQQAKFHTMSKKALLENHLGIFGLAFRFGFPKLAARLHMRDTIHEVENFFMNVVKATVKYREENHVKRNDFMNLLLDLKNKDGSRNLSIQELAAQSFIFLVAGSDSSSNTLAFALYELALNGDLQDRAREDINRVLQEHNQQLSYECLQDMKYLHQILQETLRLYNPLLILNRVALADHAVPGHPEFVIKKGMHVIIPITAIHRDERYFPNPDKFDPENFSPERIALRDSFSYLPFGDGPRNCIGSRFAKMQVLTALILLLKDFRFSVCAETFVPMQYDKKNFMLTPNGDLYLAVAKL